MAHDGQWLVYTVDGVPDHYNTKPPFVLWLQAAGFIIFGFYDWVLRIPSFLALIGVIALFVCFARWFNYPLLVPLTAALILLSTPGAIRPHVFLTGDLDGVLTFFTTALSLLMIRIAGNQAISNKEIWLAVLFLTAAYFTKSTASLLLMPSFFFLLLKQKMIMPLIKQKTFYIGIFVFATLVVLYYGLRAYYDEGYLATVWRSEFCRFTSNVMDWNQQPFSFYLLNILKRFNPYYAIVTLLLMIPYFILKEMRYRREVLNLFLVQLIFLVVISIPSVKLEWYDAPVYPLWALALSIMIIELAERFLYSKQYYFYFALFVLFAIPVYQIVRQQLLAERVLFTQEKEAAVLNESFFQNEKKYKVLMDVEENKLHHFDALKFYVKSIRLNEGIEIELARYLYDVDEQDHVLVLQENKMDSLNALFVVKRSLSEHNHFWHVIQKK